MKGRPVANRNAYRERHQTEGQARKDPDDLFSHFAHVPETSFFTLF